jgi:hypothetical protein
VISDVPVDDEAPVVTSRIFRSAGAQSFGGAHRDRVCVPVIIGVSVRVCCERLRCTVFLNKHTGGLFYQKKQKSRGYLHKYKASGTCYGRIQDTN